MGEREVSGARHNEGARKRFYFFLWVSGNVYYWGHGVYD